MGITKPLLDEVFVYTLGNEAAKNWKSRNAYLQTDNQKIKTGILLDQLNKKKKKVSI